MNTYGYGLKPLIFKSCFVLLLLLLLLMRLFGDVNVSVDDSNTQLSENGNKIEFPETFRIPTNKRTKESKHSDEIRVNEKKVFTEAHSTSWNEYHTQAKHKEYEKYKTYDKYGAKGSDIHSKYTKRRTKDKKTNKRYACEQLYPKKPQCTAFLLTRNTNSRSYLLQSVHGDPLTLASIYNPVDVISSLGIFSNKARGSYNNECDIGTVYVYNNRSQEVAKSRYHRKTAELVYVTVLGTANAPFNLKFVTSMSMPKGSCSVDAYNAFVSASSNQSPYTQYDLNTQSGDSISEYANQGACTDIFFFKDECVRWLCMAPNPEYTMYLRDPSTDTNYIPPEDSIPLSRWYNLIDTFFEATSARFCGNNYYTTIMSALQMPQNFVISLVRSRVSLSYPYFDDSELFYTFTKDNLALSGAVYSPADTDVLYACHADSFWRFDNVYTAPVPVRPTVETIGPWSICTHIVSFTECLNEVYVAASNVFFYSSNGGRTFAPVVSGGNFDVRFVKGLTGFACKQ